MCCGQDPGLIDQSRATNIKVLRFFQYRSLKSQRIMASCPASALLTHMPGPLGELSLPLLARVEALPAALDPGRWGEYFVVEWAKLVGFDKKIYVISTHGIKKYISISTSFNLACLAGEEVFWRSIYIFGIIKCLSLICQRRSGIKGDLDWHLFHSFFYSNINHFARHNAN